MKASTDYATKMAGGAREYEAALAALAASGFVASFTQTGGMCAALEVRLERGYLLLTDFDEELPWRRSLQRGWGVGYYQSDDVSDGPMAFVEREDPSPGVAVELVRLCLRDVSASANR